MTAVRKFLFDTSFDAGGKPAARPRAASPAPAPAQASAPAVSEEDVARARREGQAAGYAEGEAAGRRAAFDEGRAAGREEAHQAGAHLTAEALAALDLRMQALLARHAETQAEAERRALGVARAAVAKLFPVLAAREGLGEVEGLLADCLARLGEEPRVVVRVADDLYDALDAQIPALARKSGFEGKVVLLSEPDLAPGDLRVEWADGGAERDAAALAAEVDALLERALAAPAAADDATPRDDAAPRDDGNDTPNDPTLPDDGAAADRATLEG
jgi:flagellar assembly protein FliH